MHPHLGQSVAWSLFCSQPRLFSKSCTRTLCSNSMATPFFAPKLLYRTFLLKPGSLGIFRLLVCACSLGVMVLLQVLAGQSLHRHAPCATVIWFSGFLWFPWDWMLVRISPVFGAMVSLQGLRSPCGARWETHGSNAAPEGPRNYRRVPSYGSPQMRVLPVGVFSGGTLEDIPWTKKELACVWLA